jgi:hypothetical protein
MRLSRTTFGRMILNRMTLSELAFRRMTLGRMIMNRMTLRRMRFGRMTFGKMRERINSQQKDTKLNGNL